MRFALRKDAPSAGDFAACLLFDDGRILFEPRDSRLAGVLVQGLVPPLRPTPLDVALRRNAERASFTACMGLSAFALALIAGAQWLACHP